MDFWIKAILSLGVATLAGYVILHRRGGRLADREAREWAFGVLGLLLGYWLAP